MEYRIVIVNQLLWWLDNHGPWLWSSVSMALRESLNDPNGFQKKSKFKSSWGLTGRSYPWIHILIHYFRSKVTNYSVIKQIHATCDWHSCQDVVGATLNNTTKCDSISITLLLSVPKLSSPFPGILRMHWKSAREKREGLTTDNRRSCKMANWIKVLRIRSRSSTFS